MGNVKTSLMLHQMSVGMRQGLVEHTIPVLVGQEHDDPVNTHAETAGRWQTILKCLTERPTQLISLD